MRQRVVFVRFLAGTTRSYSHGIAALAACLTDQGSTGRDVSLVTMRNADEDILPTILSENPTVVLVSCTSNHWELAETLARRLKQASPGLPLCLGGAHATADTMSAKGSMFDLVVPGEAELHIAGVVDRASRDLSAAQRYVTETDFRKSVVEDLDATPLPYLGLFERQDILAYPSLMFSRGCPHGCHYCLSRRGGFVGRVRWKSPERAMREVASLLLYAHPDEVYLDDDSFLKNPSWVKAFCDLYRKGCRLPFYCNTNPTDVTSDVVAALKEANCAGLGIGVESGSERIRRQVLGRPAPNHVIERAFELAHKAGLATWSFMMVGAPTETVEDLQESILFNDKLGASFTRVTLFTAYPGMQIPSSREAIRSNTDYICHSPSLSSEASQVCEQWIRRLREAGRLWYTDDEMGRAR